VIIYLTPARGKTKTQKVKNIPIVIRLGLEPRTVEIVKLNIIEDQFNLTLVRVKDT